MQVSREIRIVCERSFQCGLLENAVEEERYPSLQEFDKDELANELKGTGFLVCGGEIKKDLGTGYTIRAKFGEQIPESGQIARIEFYAPSGIIWLEPVNQSFNDGLDGGRGVTVRGIRGQIQIDSNSIEAAQKIIDNCYNVLERHYITK